MVPCSERAQLELARLLLGPLQEDMLEVGIPLQPMKCRERALARAAHHPLAGEDGEFAHHTLGRIGAGVRALHQTDMLEVQGD